MIIHSLFYYYWLI